MLEKFCYQTQIVFQQLECPVSETLLCGIDIGYSGIKIQSPFNASTIPSIVVKERHDAPLLVGSEDIRYRDEKGRVWYVGSLAKKTLLHGSTAVKPTMLLGRQRVQSEDFLVQLRVGLFFSKLKDLPEGGYDIDDRPIKVQTGLPPEFIVQDSEELRNKFVGEHRYSVKVGKRPWVNVRIKLDTKDVFICKQPFGTLMASVINSDGVMTNPALLKKNVLILDSSIYEQKCEDIRQAIEKHQEELNKVVSEKSADNSWVEFFKKYRKIHALDRALLVMLVDHIDVFEGNRFKVFFKYQSQYEIAKNYIAEKLNEEE